MGALAPFLCLVRTFRVGFHSALRSKGPKYDIRPLGISPPRPVVSAPFFSASSAASVSRYATRSVGCLCFISGLCFIRGIGSIHSPLSLSLSYKIFSFGRKNNKKREREE